MRVALSLSLLLVACAEDAGPDLSPCVSAIDCASNFCAVDAPGGGYCTDESVGTQGHPCEEGACPGALQCRALGVSSACVLAGTTPCDAGFAACSERCANLLDDPLHCGSCDSPCPVGADCSLGQCQCPEGTTACGSVCADLDRDVNHCGQCDAACAPANGVGACEAGNCVLRQCDEGHASCDGDPSVGCTVADARRPTARVTVDGTLRESVAGLPGHVTWVRAGDAITLDGSDSDGVDASVTAYDWVLVSAPPAAPNPLSATDSTQVVLQTTLVGTYEVDLFVRDSSDVAACRPERVTIWAENPQALRFELSWTGPGDLDLHLMAKPLAGGDWFHPEQATWEGNPDLDWGHVGEPFDDPVLLLGGDDQSPLEVWAIPAGLGGPFTEPGTGVRVAVRRPFDGLGGEARATLRQYGNVRLPYPEDDLHFVWEALLGEGELWDVGITHQRHSMIPNLTSEGGPVLVPAPDPP